MKSIKLYFSIVVLSVLAFSCGEDLNSNPQNDFRDAFVGIYDCEKGSTTIELEVKIDPDNEGNLIIGPYSIPVEEDGSYGTAELEQNIFIELRFDGDEIYYSEHKPIPDGIVLPCELIGTKRT